MKIAITGIRGIPANYGGFETCAEETAMRFARWHEVTVFCRKHNSDYEDQSYKGVNLERLGSINSKHLDTLSHTLSSVLKIIGGKRPEVVHLYNAANAIFIPLLKIFGIRVVVSVDGLEWKRQKWGVFARLFHKISEKFCGYFADAIITDSRIVQNYYTERLGIKTIFIPYGPQIDETVQPELLNKFGLKPRSYLLFVGRLVPEKGVHNLISAYRQANIDIPLVIVGDDSNHMEYKQVLKNFADDNIKFLGFVYGDDYQALNKYPYAYVTASMLEGTSPALVSAMGAGNCVLVNGIDENRSTIGDAGIWFRENDTNDLAEKLRLIAADGALVENYRRRAYEYVGEHYNWDRVADQYLSLFNKLIGRSEIISNEDSSELVKAGEYEPAGRE